MLVTFKSRAAGDVIMFGTAAQALLARLEKDMHDVRGIFTAAQLPAAIAQLKALIAEGKALKEVPSEADEEPSSMSSPVALWQRAVPLLELMTYALAEEHAVTWEQSGQ